MNNKMEIKFQESAKMHEQDRITMDALAGWEFGHSNSIISRSHYLQN